MLKKSVKFFVIAALIVFLSTTTSANAADAWSQKFWIEKVTVIDNRGVMLEPFPASAAAGCWVGAFRIFKGQHGIQAEDLDRMIAVSSRIEQLIAKVDELIFFGADLTPVPPYEVFFTRGGPCYVKHLRVGDVAQ